MIASKQIAFGGSAKKWENPYITDGLVAMWDGEWNAGGGKHDANATVCKNLVGDFDVTGSVYGENSFIGASGIPALWTPQDSIFNGNFTFEWVLNPDVELNGILINVDNGTNAQNRYRVSGVRSGYANYQIYYWDGSSYASVYPMAKASNYQGALVFEDGIFSVYSNGEIIKSYSAVAPTDTIRCQLAPNQTFCNLRASSRALTAEEIAYNYNIDKARFGL